LFQKDALFFDCNKFIGGFSTPSILVVKAALVKHLGLLIIGSSKVQ